MNLFNVCLGAVLMLMSVSVSVVASELPTRDISEIISKEEFLSYENVADFIEHSPKVTVFVAPEADDIANYGTDVMKTLTGSDCDRDGKMDSNPECNAVFYKLWVKYQL
ncbi:hypothetical protein GCM10009347_35360 [Shewanella algicola]|uniref:Calcium-binding protein n=1 Tax=Shewanella algicola TaxID=640633 RepID=A0A9X1Z7R3_9GAMM|nr:hypothetical protein [Shewanella algicola]MCL1107253.1 hypothetical protein [Shewanella algicola]GGP66757.1 hypothetical protein GCM10009347_35360 [Shewanella algicola]